jgi:dephospho-CoA kinase
MDEQLARRMLDAQETREERLAAADDTITNAGTPDQLNRQVDHLHGQYLRLARGEVRDLAGQKLPSPADE